MKAYKLFRVLKDGNISSLFIDKRRRYNLNEWMTAECIPTKGFKVRAGWHCTHKPNAPHLSMKNRKWYTVDIKDVTEVKRPETQGGLWYTANKIKILGEV